MNCLDPKIVAKTASLARLKLNDEEQERMSRDLGSIFALFDAINQPEINALEPLGHPLGQRQRLREDKASTTEMTKYIEKNAPNAENGFITVPKVIE